MAEGAITLRGLLRSVGLAIRLAEARVLGRIIASDVAKVGWRVKVVRPDDLLVLEFGFLDFTRDGDTLRRSGAGKARLVVTHQTQSLADEAYVKLEGQGDYEADPTMQGHQPDPAPAPPPPGTPPAAVPPSPGIPAKVPIRAAGPSRLVFAMPEGEDSLPFTLDALLDACRRWPLHLDSAAQPEAPESRLDGLIWLSRDLAFAMGAARLALRQVLTPDLSAALDRVAQQVADRTLERTRAGDPPAPDELEAEAYREAEALLADHPEAASARGAAGLLIRASAARRTVIGLRRGRESVDSIAQLVPRFFGILLGPHEPAADETAIELPWRLQGSPLPSAGFTHATAPVVRNDRTELWHTRLGTRIETGGGAVAVDDSAEEKLRYLWSKDYGDPVAGGPNFSLDGLDRDMIVRLTAGYDEVEPNGGVFVPRPVVAKRMMLTALGGLLDADRRWSRRPDKVDLMAWTHRASQGRDFYVRVEYAGFLFPTGHAATLVKLSERQFEWRGGGAAAGDRVAALRQRYFIVVREKVRAYPDGPPQPFQGRAMPFDTIECLVKTTPDLVKPGSSSTGDDRLDDGFYGSEMEWRRAFWPSRGETGGASLLFPFPLVGVDSAGRRIPFTTPLLFVSEVLNRSGPIQLIRDHYNGLGPKPAPEARRRMQTGGAIIRFADPAPGAADVDIPTLSMVIVSVDPAGGILSRQDPLLQQQPIVDWSSIEHAAAKRLTGKSVALKVRYAKDYLDGGFAGAGPGEIFLRAEPTALDFGGGGAATDSVGAVAAPSMKVAGLSRRFGLASSNNPAGPAAFAAGQFDPKDFFPDAKLLGFFSLKDLLRPVPLGPEAPILQTVELADRFETVFRLVQDVPAVKLAKSLMTGEGGTSRLTLTATSILPKNGSGPTSKVEGVLDNFKIDLAGVLILHFDRLSFVRETGHKPDVNVDLNPANAVTFGGPLEFVNALKDFIPANGFSDPPVLQVTPEGLTVGYSLGLPDIQCGILSLSNISLGSSFTLPFTGGAPTARFNFAERHNTFNLTVSLFGGGGFFAVVVAADGVKEIEAALEFGAQIAINLGVASGRVYVKGGFYFHYATSGTVEFQGYVEIGGRLSVLGLISVSLTFNLTLAYESIALPNKPDGSPHSQSRLYGQATLVVEIEILFFSVSVSVQVEKTFAGSEADPKFIDFIPAQTVWDEYCGAFA